VTDCPISARFVLSVRPRIRGALLVDVLGTGAGWIGWGT
jgi:hypothetical protein